MEMVTQIQVLFQRFSSYNGLYYLFLIMQYNCELASVNALINGGGRIMASSAEIVTCDQIFAIQQNS